MQKKFPNHFMLLGLIFLLVFGQACSTTKSVVSKMTSERAYLKKRVMVFPPVDHSGLAPDKAAEITEGLIGELKASDRLLIYPSPENIPLPEDARKPRHGVAYYDEKLAEMARDRNMNAILAVYLPPIQRSEGRKGIWPFRRKTDICKISMVTNVVDVTNGCLYLTEFYSKAVPLASEKAKNLEEEELFARALETAMPDMLNQQATAVLGTLTQEPWVGRILETGSDSYIISAGKDVGVRKGQEFMVYSRGESIVCLTGKTVDLLGEKRGKIKVATVGEDHSAAVPTEGGPFRAGETILFVPE